MNFDEGDIRKGADAMSVTELVDTFGEPRRTERAAETHGHWRQGMAVPALAVDDPAVNAAMGRCGLDRMALPSGLDRLTIGHPWGPCGWCDMPVREVMAALDWYGFHARFVPSIVLVWDGDHRSRYVRIVKGPGYTEPKARAFAALSSDEQTRRVRDVVIRSQQSPSGVDKDGADAVASPGSEEVPAVE